MDRVARLVILSLILFWVVALARTCGVGEPEAARESTPTPRATATLAPTRTPRPTPSPTPVLEVHVVKAGETLWSIAQDYGVTVADLIMVNDLVDPSNLHVGDEVRIPPRRR